MAFYQTLLADRIVGAVASASPGAGWTAVADFATLVLNARTANLPLYLKPGVYTTTSINIISSTGGGNPLRMYAPSGATVQLSANSSNIFWVDGVSGVWLEGIFFNGGGFVSTESTMWSGFLRFNGDISYTVSRCQIAAWSKAGVAATAGAIGKVTDTQFWALNYGFVSLDCFVTFERNRVVDCKNGGVYVWTSTASTLVAKISDNFIQNIRNEANGTGEYGNGVSIYRAGNVVITGNTIYQCDLSAIRINGGSNCEVIGNKIWSTGDAGIFNESPGPDVVTIGNIISHNIIDAGHTGILAGNVGLYGDGLTRRTIITGNQIINTATTGMIIEGGCVATSNTIEGAQIGMQVGTNNAAFDLDVSSNYLLNCNMAIAYSANSAAAGLLISSNVVKGYRSVSSVSDPNYPTSGAIVSASYDGTSTKRDKNGTGPNTDYGNALPIKVGGATIGMNTARV